MTKESTNQMTHKNPGIKMISHAGKGCVMRPEAAACVAAAVSAKPEDCLLEPGASLRLVHQTVTEEDWTRIEALMKKETALGRLQGREMISDKDIEELLK